MSFLNKCHFESFKDGIIEDGIASFDSKDTKIYFTV